jgi:alpha-glucoside transport system substrate-binding protein
MRQRFMILASVLALVLAACANVPGATPSPRATATAGDAMTELERAEAGEFSGTTVTVLAQWIDAEGDNMEANLAPFAERTGIDIQYEGITDYETVLTVRVEGGDPPDIAQIAQPGKMRDFQEQGNLVSLSDVLDPEEFAAAYPTFVDLAMIDGEIYGLPYKADLKSIVWYPVEAFADAGYDIPTTWDELVALSDQIVADGGVPWCISIEHGDASGWVATDWLEDILLRTAPLETYDAWVAHEIPFDDPAVLNAAELMSQIWFNEGYVYGGNTAINATWVGDTQTPMFNEDLQNPGCWMHKQAAWIPGFWPMDDSTDPPTPLYEAGTDVTFFYFPPIDEEFGSPVLGGGDHLMMFNDRPEVRAVMQYLATPEGSQAWIETGTFVSPNVNVPEDWYQVFPASGLAEILRTATALRFDASDLMPAEVGQGTFWAGMVDWVAANGEGTEEIFAEIEASWP